MRSDIAVVVVYRPKEDQVFQSLTPAATSWLEGSVESVTRQARLRSAGRVGVYVCACVWVGRWDGGTLVGQWTACSFSGGYRSLRGESSRLRSTLLIFSYDHGVSSGMLYLVVDS